MEKLTPFLLLCSLLILPCSAQDCLSDTSFSQNRSFATCQSLSELSGVLHWTYHPSNATLDIAYRAPQSSTGWVSWALNPTGTGMREAQSLIAFKGSSGAITVYASLLSSYTPTIQDGNLSFTVYSKAGEYSSGSMTIYATLALPSNKTVVNHVWQAGTQFDSNGVPSGHSLTDNANKLSLGSLDFLSGTSSASGGVGGPRLHRKNTHGVLNAVSWGILLPLGAIIARYLKVFKSADPAWFYLHVVCQCSAYVIGVAGWGTGLKLGSDSPGITYHKHRNIGISMFCLATLQVFALLLRPNKDNKYRIYWNVYHHSIGYLVIILSVVNIFKGFDILNPGGDWKHAYIGVIGTLGGVALVLEVVTWVIVLRRRSRGSDKSHNDAQVTNGYGTQQHQGV